MIEGKLLFMRAPGRDSSTFFDICASVNSSATQLSTNIDSKVNSLIIQTRLYAGETPFIRNTPSNVVVSNWLVETRPTVQRNWRMKKVLQERYRHRIVLKASLDMI